jgi:iron complex transport system ATP-binding protein
MLKVQNISFAIGKKNLVHNVSFEAKPNEFVVIMGMNGAGKSTLLKMIAASLKPTVGNIFIDNALLKSYTTEALSLKRAMLSQHYDIAFPATVEDMVMMGRYPYFTTNPTQHDEAIVQECMHTVGISNFANRDYNSLSGGEAQKVQMARVLAQVYSQEEDAANILLLDEPVSHLDMKHQHQLLQIARQKSTANTLVIAVLHDINLAIKYATRILFMKDGRLCYELWNAKKLTTSVIKEVFDVEAEIMYNKNGVPIVMF